MVRVAYKAMSWEMLEGMLLEMLEGMLLEMVFRKIRKTNSSRT